MTLRPGCVVGLWLLFAGAPSWAAPPTAARLFDEGRRAYARHAYPEAARSLLASLAQRSSPITRLYLARCYRQMGQIGTAYVHLRLAAREAQELVAGERRYATTRDAANREAADLEERVPKVVLVPPRDAPQDLQIRLDGAAVPRAAWGTELPVDPGQHRVLTTGQRLRPQRLRVTVAEGAVQRVELTPRRLPTATLALDLPGHPPGLVVSVDGKPLPSVELDQPQYLDVGEHEVQVTAPGYAPYRFRQKIKDGETVQVPVRLRVAGGTPRWVFYSVAAGAVAAGVIGGGLLAYAQNTQNAELARLPEDRDPATRDRVRQSGAAGTAFLVIGGLGVAAAGVLAFTTRFRDRELVRPARAQILPWLGPGAVGLSLAGGF